MTTTEINKLKLMSILHPNTNMKKLEKYFCKNCRAAHCKAIWNSGQFDIDDNFKIIYFHRDNDRSCLITIYTCFERVFDSTNSIKWGKVKICKRKLKSIS